MQKHVLTKIVGIINSFLFMFIFAGSIIMLIVNGLFLAGSPRVFEWFTPEFFSLNFPIYNQLIFQFIPSVAEFAFLIIFGVIFILSLLNFAGSINQIKISNLETIKFYKKRGSLRFKNLCFLIFCGLIYFTYNCPVAVIKYASWGIGAWFLISFVLISIDVIRGKKAFKTLKRKLIEEIDNAPSPITTQPVELVSDNNAPLHLNPSIPRDKKLINEIAKIDKLQQDGVISKVRYTKLREQLIKEYGKGIVKDIRKA